MSRFCNLKMRPLALAAVLVFASLSAAVAGGFWITIHSAASPLGAKTLEAAVLVEVGGCANPADATLRGTAEGLVDGKRRSLPLEFIPTSKRGVYAVKKQWPVEGAWVLAISGTLFGHSSSQLVELGPKGQYRARAVEAKQLAARVEEALKS